MRGLASRRDILKLSGNALVAFSAWCLPAESACDGGGTSTRGLVSRRLRRMLGANALVFVKAGSCSGKRGKSVGCVKVPGNVFEITTWPQ
jgi:hypothetical protein